MGKGKRQDKDTDGAINDGAGGANSGSGDENTTRTDGGVNDGAGFRI